MDTTQIEAMLVRAHHAFRLRKDGEVDFADAIALIVAPTPELLAASMSVAEASGPGAEARRLAARNFTKRKPRVRVAKAVRERQTARIDTTKPHEPHKVVRSESLDQVLARL